MPAIFHFPSKARSVAHVPITAESAAFTSLATRLGLWLHRKEPLLQPPGAPWSALRMRISGAGYQSATGVHPRLLHTLDYRFTHTARCAHCARVAQRATAALAAAPSALIRLLGERPP